MYVYADKEKQLNKIRLNVLIKFIKKNPQICINTLGEKLKNNLYIIYYTHIK